MERAALLLAGALVSLSLQAQNKKIYIPEDLLATNEKRPSSCKTSFTLSLNRSLLIDLFKYVVVTQLV